MRVWRRRTLLGLGLILLLVLQLALPALADFGRPKFQFLSITPSVQAGQALHIAVQASMPDPNEGLCCGSIWLQSPSGKQSIYLHLTLTGGQLTADTTLSPGAEGGTWKVQRLILIGNGLADTRLEAGADFNYTFQVFAGAVDSAPPRVTSLVWSVPTATQGTPVTITANATDDATDVAAMTVTVVPVQDAGDPRWWLGVRMEKQPNGTWAGTFLAPVMAIPKGKIRISEVYVRDGAGNSLDLTGSDLAGLRVADLPVVPGATPPGLQTDPNLVNLLYPGAMDFLEWNRKDMQALSALWDQMGSDPDGMKAAVNYQLLVLQRSLADLRKEIYQDPTSKYRYVPYNTSGKWRAVEKAIRNRLRLLTEAQRRAGQSTAKRLEKQDFMAFTDILFDNGDWLTAYNPATYAQAGPALMNAVINTVNRGSLPSGLMLAPHRAPDDDALSFVDPGLIWFEPFSKGDTLAEHYDDGREISLYLSEVHTPLAMVKDLFHEMGHHFHDAYMINPDGYNVDATAWNDYLRLRGNQTWTDKAGWGGRPWENFAEDFAYATLPEDLRPQYLTNQTAYPRLMDHPDMLQAFRDFLGKRIAAGAEPALTFDTPDRLQLGGQGVRFTGHWLPQAVYAVATGTAWDDTVVKQGTGSTNADGSFAITAPLQAYGPNYVYIGLNRPNNQNPHIRFFTVLNSAFLPVILPPRATNQPSASFDGWVTGNMQINGQSAAGAVHNSVALTPGENTVTLNITPSTGTPYKLTTQVFYEPAGTTVPLTVQAPPLVNETSVTLTGTTVPYALVSVAAAHAAADQEGKFSLLVPTLVGGENDLTVTATSPAGNVANAKVIVTSQVSGGVTVQVPALTNAARLNVTGSAVGATQVTVAGQQATLDAQGNYRAVISLRRGDNTLAIVATDASGNSTRLTRTVTLDPNLVPAYATTPTVDWTGIAPTGAQVKFQGQPVELGSDGSYRVTLPLTKGGTNTFRLDITPAGGEPVYYEANIVKPMVLDAPAYTNAEKLTLHGSTGSTFNVDLRGRPLHIGVEGVLQVPVTLQPGPNDLTFRVSRITAPWAIPTSGGALMPPPVPQGAGDNLRICAGNFTPIAFGMGALTPAGVICGHTYYAIPGAPRLGSMPSPATDQADWSQLPPGLSLPPGFPSSGSADPPAGSGSGADGDASTSAGGSLPTAATVSYTVTRFDPKGSFSGGFWTGTLPQIADGTVFTVRGTKIRVTERDGVDTTIQIPVQQGYNDIHVDYQDADGQPAFIELGLSVGEPVVLVIGSTSAKVGDHDHTLTAPPQKVNGVTMVPLRFVAEALNANVNYDVATHTITFTRDLHTVVLTVGSDQASVDGKTLTMAQPAQVVGGSTLVPLRFVVQSLGVQLQWDNDTQTITLTP